MEELGTGRLEAFCDDGFAIATTLLILEINVPRGHGDLGDELLHLWPSHFASVTSFLSIGVMWINENAIFARLARVDHTLLFLNTLLPLVVAFIPFPTRLIADLPSRRGRRGTHGRALLRAHRRRARRRIPPPVAVRLGLDGISSASASRRSRSTRRGYFPS